MREECGAENECESSGHDGAADSTGQAVLQNPLRDAQRRPDAERLPGAQRLPGIEVFRGLAIVAVIAIHVSDELLPGLKPTSAAWFVLAIVNRSLQFAVPGFLLASAFVLSRGLLRGTPLRAYFSGRARRLLRPYLLWSVLVGIVVWRQDAAHFEWTEAARRVLTGKSFGHLYFLGVALQMSLVLPLLLPLLRRRPPFGIVAPGTVALALLIYAANRWLLRLQYVGSFVGWYVLAIALGWWLAGQEHRWREALRRGWLAAGIVTLAALSVFLPLSIHGLRGQAVNTFVWQMASWSYGASASFLLLAMAQWWQGMNPQHRAIALLRDCGRRSLEIYLLHPIVLLTVMLLPTPRGALLVMAAFIAGCFFSLIVPCLLTQAIAHTRLARWLFGRDEPAMDSKRGHNLTLKITHSMNLDK